MTFLRKLRWPSGRRQKEAELRAELEFHLEEEAEERHAQGLPIGEARRAASRELGNIELVRENTREAWGWMAAERLWQDVRFGARMLRKNPGFTAVAIATLAIGIGVNATLVTIANAVLFKGFPLVARNDRLVYMTTGVGCCVSWPDFQDWRAQAKSFEGMALVHGVQKTVTDGAGFPEVYDATEVTSDTFKLTGQAPILGRDFAPPDETPGANPVAVVSYNLWEKRYHQDGALIGRVLRMNNVLTTVIGIMPKGYTFPQKADLWVPLVATPKVQQRGNRETWFVFGRLADWATIESARAEMVTIGHRLGDAYPLTNQGRNLAPHVLNFRDFFIGPNATVIYEAMFAAVAFLLLMACANLANLLLSRSMGRAREISVRMALGAGRWRIVRQLLLESLMLSGLGGFGGWWIAKWGVQVYTLSADGAGLSDAIGGSWFDHVLDYSMDAHVLAYSIAISIGTGLLFGLAPALRLSKFDVAAALKNGGRGVTAGGRARHLTALIVAAEMALSIVLLAGAGVTIRSFLNFSRLETGVNAGDVLTAQVPLSKDVYPDDAARVSFYQRLSPRLRAIPGVEDVAFADKLPTRAADKRPVNSVRRIPFEPEGVHLEERDRPSLGALAISPGYFRTLGAAVLEGRDFRDGDGLARTPVALVNRQFAEQYWPGESPLGKRLRLIDGKAPEERTVVGVVSNISENDTSRNNTSRNNTSRNNTSRNDSAEGGMSGLVYLPWRQKPTGSVWILMKAHLSSGSLSTALRREIQSIDSHMPVLKGPSALSERMNEGYAFKGSIAVLLAVFAGIALLLASTGLYGVVASSVSQRTQEIGIRVALGAGSREIRRLVVWQGMLPAGIGLAIGLMGAFALTPVLKSVLLQVSPVDPGAFAGAAAVLIVAALLGCVIPARRAARVDPVVALRHD